MRIIAGKYRGKRLFSPDGNKTRPTADKIKESVFNILASAGELQGSVLDLFAGTGALGIEALSRGADSAVFVDKSPEAAAIVKKNLALVGATARVYNTDWKVAVRKLIGQKFDLIFLDPPYALGFETELLAEIMQKQLLAPSGVIVVEHASYNNFEFDGRIFSADRRDYSIASVTFLRFRGAENEE